MWNTSIAGSYAHSRLAKYFKKTGGGPGGEEGVDFLGDFQVYTSPQVLAKFSN